MFAALKTDHALSMCLSSMHHENALPISSATISTDQFNALSTYVPHIVIDVDINMPAELLLEWFFISEADAIQVRELYR